MKLKKCSYYLGAIFILSFWVAILYISIKNMDTTLWGVGILFAFICSVATSMYIYLTSMNIQTAEEHEQYTVMSTNISNDEIQPGDCLFCYQILGPTNTIKTNCDHTFHRSCYYEFNVGSERSSNPNVFFCPYCKALVHTQTVTCYTGPMRDVEEEINRERMVEISID